MTKYDILLASLACLPLFGATDYDRLATAPRLLNSNELVTLSATERPAKPLADKVTALLETRSSAMGLSSRAARLIAHQSRESGGSPGCVLEH